MLVYRSWEKSMELVSTQKPQRYVFRGVFWWGTVWLEIVVCNRNKSFVIVNFISGHIRYQAQNIPFGARPPDLVFEDLQSRNYFWAQISQERWSIQVLTSHTSQTIQTLASVWGMVRKPHHWVLMRICSASCVNTSLDRLLTLASEPSRFPQLIWTSPCACLAPPVGLKTLEDITPRSGRWPLKNRLYTFMFILIKSSNFKGRVKKMHFLKSEWLNFRPLSCLAVFRC